MKLERFSVGQIVAIIEQAERIRRVGISDQTFYRSKGYSNLEHRGLADGIQCGPSSRCSEERTPNEFAGNCHNRTLE